MHDGPRPSEQGKPWAKLSESNQWEGLCADQPRAVVFCSCLTGLWRLFSALSIPFSSDVSFGDVSCIAALARSLAASMNLSVLSFASNAMIFARSSLKSYSRKWRMSSNPSSLLRSMTGGSRKAFGSTDITAWAEKQDARTDSKETHRSWSLQNNKLIPQKLRGQADGETAHKLQKQNKL